MILNRRILLFFSLFFILCFFAIGLSETEQTNDKNLARVFVIYNENNNLGNKVLRLQTDIRSTVKDKINSIDGGFVSREFKSFNGFLAYVPESKLSELEKDSNIKSVYRDYKVHTFLQTSVPLINATPTWSLQVNGINLTGKSQTVCIIDSGIDTDHPDLQNNILSQYCYCDNDPMNPPNGCCPNSLNEGTSAEDDNGHGTHVAGIIAANGNIKGVAPQAKVISVKTMNSSGTGWNSDIISGIEWCIANASKFNISVISMSLGGDTLYTNYCDSSDTATASVINSAIANNISVIVAAGNDHSSTGITSPACIQNATPVAATTKNDAIDTGYSNRNWMVSLAAPGTDINSTMITSPGGTVLAACGTGSTYCLLDGTSMATPHVAAAFAIINQYLNLSRRKYTPQQIEQVLNSTGKKINDSGGSNLNYSRIDIYAAIQSLGDFVSPSVTLNLPANNYNTTLNQTNFSCSATDNFNITNVTLYHNYTGNFAANTTNSSAVQGSYTFIKNLTQGRYLWNCYACDNSSNCAFASSNFTLTIDQTAPYFSPLPSNQNASYGIAFSYDINASDVLTQVSSFRVNDTNFSINSDGLISNATLLLVRTYYLNISVNDSVGNLNSTLLNITVYDLTSPYFNHSINSTQYIEYGDSFAYDLNATDNYAFANYSVNNTNFTINNSGYLSNNTGLSIGSYNLNITINDTSGNQNSTLITVVVQDTRKPYFVTLLQDQKINYSSSLGYQINATDNFVFANYSVNDTTRFRINNSGYLSNNTALSVGKYSINISINDTFGNTNSSVITVTVHINVSSPVNASTSTDIDTSSASSNITLFLSQAANSTIVVTKETPTASWSVSSKTAVKGVNITVDNATNSSLTWAYIKIYYNSSDFSGLDTSSFRIYYYNETSAAWQLESSSNVDTANLFVWANVSHFSLFGIFGSTTSSGNSNTGGGGGSSSTTQAISLTRTSTTYSQLSQGSKFLFNANDGLTHSLILSKIDTSKVDFTLASTPTTFSLLIGEDKIANLSSTEQLYIQLLSISNRKADINLKSIIKKELAILPVLPKPTSIKSDNTDSEKSLVSEPEQNLSLDTKDAQLEKSFFDRYNLNIILPIIVLILALILVLKNKEILLGCINRKKRSSGYGSKRIKETLEKGEKEIKDVERILNKSKKIK